MSYSEEEVFYNCDNLGLIDEENMCYNLNSFDLLSDDSCCLSEYDSPDFELKSDSMSDEDELINEFCDTRNEILPEDVINELIKVSHGLSIFLLSRVNRDYYYTFKRYLEHDREMYIMMIYNTGNNDLLNWFEKYSLDQLCDYAFAMGDFSYLEHLNTIGYKCDKIAASISATVIERLTILNENETHNVAYLESDFKCLKFMANSLGYEVNFKSEILDSFNTHIFPSGMLDWLKENNAITNETPLINNEINE